MVKLETAERDGDNVFYEAREKLQVVSCACLKTIVFPTIRRRCCDAESRVFGQSPPPSRIPPSYLGRRSSTHVTASSYLQ